MSHAKVWGECILGRGNQPSPRGEGEQAWTVQGAEKRPVWLELREGECRMEERMLEKQAVASS